MAQGTRGLAARRHRDAPVMQLLLEHRDCRLGIALLALGDCDGSRDADREAAARGPGAVLPERLVERLAIGLIAHGRWGGRLGVAVCGDAQASNQRHDCGGEQCGCLFHLRLLSLFAGTRFPPARRRWGPDGTDAVPGLLSLGSSLSQAAQPGSSHPTTSPPTPYYTP